MQKVTRKKSKASRSHPEKPAITAGEGKGVNQFEIANPQGLKPRRL
jgi:hypothetical protein